MDRPLTSRAWVLASPGGGRRNGLEQGARGASPARCGQVPALLRPSAPRAQELQTLRRGLAGAPRARDSS